MLLYRPSCAIKMKRAPEGTFSFHNSQRIIKKTSAVNFTAGAKLTPVN